MGCQGTEGTAATFETADAADVVRAFLWLDVVLAELMATLAVGACAPVDSQEEGGDPVERGEDHSLHGTSPKTAFLMPPGPFYAGNAPSSASDEASNASSEA